MTTTENSIIKVASTSYSVQDKWFEVAKKYFEIDDNDELNINLLKAGLFGYNNEIMSNEIKNGVYHRNVLYDEHFLNTASIPKSIYNFAKIQNALVGTATPATMKATLGIKKDDMINSSKFKKVSSTGLSDSDSTYEFVLGNDIDFVLGGFNFKLPYPVQFLFKANNLNKNYSVTARYLTDDYRFEFLKDPSPYLKIWEETYAGSRYIFATLDLFQVKKAKTEISIVTEDISENLFYNFTYSGQLAAFDIYYVYEDKRYKLNKYFNNTFTPEDNEKFCYYTFADDNKIEISFSSLPNSFRPRYNSTIEIEIYATDGSRGNFSYTGKVNINTSSDTELETIAMSILPLSDSTGGSDKPSFLDIKKELIENYLVRNNIITDKDLEILFNEISRVSKVYGSKVSFIKKRNDVIKRLWNAFLLIRNADGNVIPTKTLSSLFISSENLKDNNYTLPENTAVIYDIENDSYFAVHHILELLDYADRSKYLVFALPYLIKIDETPVLSSTYYRTFADREYGTVFKYINGSIPYQFVMSNIDVTRDSIESDIYKFNFSLNTNYVSESMDTDLKVRGILKAKSGKVYGYFDFNRVTDKELMFEGYLATEKKNIINNNKMNIYNSLFAIDTSAILDNSGNTSVVNVDIDEEVTLDIVVLLKNDYSREKYGDARFMPDVDEYGTVCLITCDETIKLFENLSNVIESNVYPTSGGMILKSVPLVEYMYFGFNYNEIYSILDVYIQSLQTSMNKLENNTNMDVKFYDTYGKSNWYYSGDTENGIISRIDLDINMNIYTNSVVSNDLDSAVKKFISDFVESCNEEMLFPISNLWRRLEEEFDFIRYIEINSINGLPVQKIESKFTSFLEMTKNEIIDYVPEYLNIRKESITTTNEAKDVIEQHYKYALTINYI